MNGLGTTKTQRRNDEETAKTCLRPYGSSLRYVKQQRRGGMAPNVGGLGNNATGLVLGLEPRLLPVIRDPKSCN